ncbi:MAG: hypothetical protein L6R19_25100 [Alphaproteobacteria bacterium]|nr:hypothetical protein [Alphaproteobacteria bacterium]
MIGKARPAGSALPGFGTTRSSTGAASGAGARPGRSAPLQEPARPAGDERSKRWRAERPAAKESSAAGWIAVAFFIGIVGLVAVAVFVPMDRLEWAWTETSDVRERVKEARLESKTGRRRASWFGPSYRIFVKVQPYSFGFAISCPGKDKCEETLARLRRGQMITLAVDKGAFEELKPTNRRIDPNTRNIDKISQQSIAMQMDRRTVAAKRLVIEGELVLGSAD